VPGAADRYAATEADAAAEVHAAATSLGVIACANERCEGDGTEEERKATVHWVCPF